MNIEEYKSKVIKLFKDGKAEDKHYGEMAEAILLVSESNNYKTVWSIDKAIEAEWAEDYGGEKKVDPIEEVWNKYKGYEKNLIEDSVAFNEDAFDAIKQHMEDKKK